MKHYAVFDTETTGLKPEQDRIIELAWIVNNNGETVEKSYLLNHNIRIPQEITCITGISSRMIEQEGVSPFKAFSEFFNDIGSLPLVGHNILRFDKPFVIKELNRLCVSKDGIARFEDRSFIDTAAFYKGLVMEDYQLDNESYEQYAMRVLETPVRGLYYNLSHVSTRLRITLTEQLHRAMADVHATHAVFQKFVSMGLI